MDDKLALFQTLATMPNAIARENKALRLALAKHVSERMAALAASPSLPEYAEGRRQYLDLLKRRAVHLMAKAQTFVEAHRNAEAIEVLGPDGEALRDFYHDAYYSVLFAARHAMVDRHKYDCHEHVELPKAIEEHLIVPGIEKEAAAKTKGALEELIKTRTTADYSVNVADLKSVASGEQIKQTFERVQEIFRLWGLS